MLNKIIKLIGITLVGAGLFASAPFIGYAQYYNGYGASVSTGNATNITPMNATFNGSVNTGGISGNAWFEYGTDVNFGNSTTLNAFDFNSSFSGSYSTNVSGLTANTIYYFRAVGQNSYGKVYGNIISFATNFSTAGYNNSMAPTAVTTSGAILSDNTAQFNGLVLTGNTSKADGWFEWGTTPALGNITPTTPVGGAPAIRHTNTITGLDPGTTYYFRSVAQNSYGRSEGVIMSLVTSGSAQAVQQNTTATKTPAKITNTNTTAVDKNPNASPTPSNSQLGASAAGAGSFLPNSLFGWMILFILILLLFILSKHLHSQFKK